MLLYPFCCAIFTAGFGLRSFGSYHFDKLGIYIATICTIYAAPPLLELANYHILGHILYYAPYHSPIHPGRVLSTFAFISGIVETLSGTGVNLAIQQHTETEERQGKAILKAALLLQIFVAAVFVALAATFQVRCWRSGLRSSNLYAPLTTLYASTAIILARTIYRTVEYFSMTKSKMNFYDPNFDYMGLPEVVRYEWYFYAFEASLMLLDVLLLNWRHPRRWLPQSNKTYLACDGKTEIKGPGLKDPRPFWQTVIDPFDFMSLVGGKQRRGFQKFWEDDSVTNGGRPMEEAPNV